MKIHIPIVDDVTGLTLSQVRQRYGVETINGFKVKGGKAYATIGTIQITL